MKNKMFAVLLCLFALLSGIGTAHAESAGETNTAAQVQNLCDGIIAYHEEQYGGESVQDLIDGYLCDNAGMTAEYYAIALSQSGDYDFNSYENALLAYLRSNEVYSAATREKYALVLSAAGSTDGYITDTVDEAIGESGVMSLIFGLHLLNNGYRSAVYSTDGLIREILSCQKDDGGWAVTGSQGDADVTAMTLQALAPYYGSRGDVTDAIDAALDLLSDIQLESGGFQSMGVENCESAAQVIVALSALEIDAQNDGRFIKSGNSVIDGMLKYRLSDGSFSHADNGMNDTATTQAFCALTAYLRMCRGQGSLYLLDHVNHDVSDVVQQDEELTYGGFQPSATSDAHTTDASEMHVSATADESGKDGYKPYAVLGVVLAAGGVCAVLFLLKKRNKKHYIAVAIVAMAGIAVILLTDFQSTDSYGANTATDGEWSVTLSIRCDMIRGLEKVNDFIPDDGVMIDEETYRVSEGDTVYDVLLAAASENNLPLDNRGTDGAAYIAGIDSLYEFDYGPLSGWMYRVNGNFTDVGCQSYYVHDGDTIEWLYTTDIGKDLE